MRVRLENSFLADLAPGTTLTKPEAGPGWLVGFMTIIEYLPPRKNEVN